jgi:hypothetical protein
MEPLHAQYLGWNKERKIFEFNIDYYGDVTHCSYKSLGITDDVAYIVDAILMLNKDNVMGMRYSYSDNSDVEIYILAKPPISLNLILPALLSMQNSDNKSWLPHFYELLK